MNASLDWGRILDAITGRAAEGWWAFAAPLAILLVGLLIATVCRVAAVRLLRRPISRLESRVGHVESVRLAGLLTSAPGVMGRLLYWVVLLLFAVGAVEALPFAIGDGVLAGAADLLPRFLLALAVLIAGTLVASFVHRWILATASDTSIGRTETLARVAWGSIVAVTLIVSAQQAGLEGAGFISSLVLIVLAAAFGAVALAFGLGAGPLVTNILASRYASKVFRVGDVVRMGEVQGAISEITATSIVVASEGGVVHLPARTFCEKACVLVGRQD